MRRIPAEAEHRLGQGVRDHRRPWWKCEVLGHDFDKGCCYFCHVGAPPTPEEVAFQKACQEFMETFQEVKTAWDGFTISTLGRKLGTFLEEFK